MRSIVDLNAIVEGMRPLLSRIAGSFIQLEMVLDPAGVWVSLGSDQVEQILLDLVVRASDAMPLGGKLVVATRRWRSDGSERDGHGVVPPGRWAALRVADARTRSEGLAPAPLSRFVVGGTGRTLTSGSDLTRVASIIERAGGLLLVEDGAQAGAEYVVHLPSNEHPSRGARVSENTPAILVVDGDVWKQTTTAHLLRRAGYGVLQADHASGALDLLRGVTGSCIRVMLVDVDLAEDDAAALTRAAQRIKADLQVLCVGRARAGSGEDLLTKPFTADELLLAVARRLGASAPG